MNINYMIFCLNKKKKFIFLIGLLFFGPACSTSHRAVDNTSTVIPKHLYTKESKIKKREGALWPGDTPRNFLFGDDKAKAVGDIITVTINETATSTQTATTDTEKSTTLNMATPNILGLPSNLGVQNFLGMGNGFDPTVNATVNNTNAGTGTVTRNGTLTGTISAMITEILPSGKNLGIKISYAEQDYPKGLPEAFQIGKNFIGKDGVVLILGDNFFYGQSLTEKLKKCIKLNSGAKVFLHPVSNPSQYGIAKINNKRKILKIIEKPKKYLSNLAITGLYFFDNKVIKYSKSLKPSKRGEIEITDLLNKYKSKKKLTADYIGRGGAWLDTGSIEDFYKTSTFVSAIENRQGFKIACLEEISFKNNWIKKRNILNAIKFYGNCDYSKYLKKIISR